MNLNSALARQLCSTVSRQSVPLCPFSSWLCPVVDSCFGFKEKEEWKSVVLTAVQRPVPLENVDRDLKIYSSLNKYNIHSFYEIYID